MTCINSMEPFEGLARLHARDSSLSLSPARVALSRSVVNRGRHEMWYMVSSDRQIKRGAMRETRDILIALLNK